MIEPLALVALDARRKNAPLPRGRRDLEARELPHDGRDAGGSLEAMRGIRMLPAGEEPQELRRRDGGDLAPEPVERVSVDPGEQSPVAPGHPAGDARPQHAALRLELAEEDLVLDAVGDRPERLEPPAEHGLRIARRLGREPSFPFSNDAPPGREGVQPLLPRPPLLRGDVSHPEERFVQLFGVRGRRPRLFADTGDRVGIERAELVRRPGVEHSPRVHGLRPPFLERGVVQERVRLRREDPPRERGRLDGVDGSPLDRAVSQPAQDLEEPVHVHRLVQAVFDGLANDRMIRHLDGTAGKGLRAGEDLRKGGGEQVVRAHAQERRRDSPASARPLEHQRALRVPAPARLEHGRGEERLDQDLAGGVRMQVVEDVVERKAVMGAERQDDRLLVRRGLELEAESDAELLSQRESPSAVDPRPERGVDDELHAAALVEEPLEDHPARRRDAAEDASSGVDVLRDLDGPALGERFAAGGPDRHRARPVPGAIRLLAEAPDLERELACPAGALPQPEGDRRRLTLRVGDAHGARLDPEDPPRRVPELEDVAAVRLDRPVLVDRPDERALRLEPHLIVRGVRDGAAREERGHPRAPGGHQPPVHAVAVEECGAATRVESDDLVELAP